MNILLVLVLCISGVLFSQDYPIETVPVEDVVLTGGSFWESRLSTNASVTIPHIFDMLVSQRYIKQLQVAAGVSSEPYPGGFIFFESDFNKCIDCAAWSLKTYPNPGLESTIDGYLQWVDMVQFADGYLNWPRSVMVNGYSFENQQAADFYAGALGDTYYVNNTRLSHELYNNGHFLEGAVSYYQATGKTNMLDIANDIGDHLDQWFSVATNKQPSGHQEIELGLVALYRATGDGRYLNLAKMFLDERGYYNNGRGSMGVYGQDHLPVKQQDEAVGHCVRGGYMYSSMVDVSALTGDMDYANAARTMWEGAVEAKMYATGGFGVPHMEGFPEDYDLPSEAAWSESCATIASMFWADRLFRLDGHAKYYDVIERSLYNAFGGSISLSGNKFNYTNPLASSGGQYRAAWHGCACCPANIPRMTAQMPQYIYAHTDDELFVNLFVSGTAQIGLNGGNVQVSQQNDYPWQGNISITLTPDSAMSFELKIRMPGWAVEQPVPSDLYTFAQPAAVSNVLRVNGVVTPISLTDGYICLTRQWSPGDQVTLDLPMPIRRLRPHPNILELEGQSAFQRGPIVYCLESVDNAGFDVRNIVISDSAAVSYTYESSLLNGVGTLTGSADFVTFNLDGSAMITAGTFKAIPYYAWQNRSNDPMMCVWNYRQTDSLTNSFPGSGIYKVDKVGLAVETPDNDADGVVKDSGDLPHVDGHLKGGEGQVFSKLDAGGNGKPTSAVLEFNGGGYVEMPSSTKYSHNGAITVACWVKPAGTLYWGTVLGRINLLDGHDSAWCLEVPGNNLHFIIPYTGDIYSSAGRSIADGQWHQVTVVFDKANSQLKLYIDGQLDNTAVTNGPGPSVERKYSVVVGGNPTRLGEIPFRGDIDDVRILNGALDGQGVADLYEDMKAHADNIAPTATASVASSEVYLTDGTVDVALVGDVVDDGLPAPYSVRWSEDSGPGGSSISAADVNDDAVATITVAGDYVFEILADDGELTDTDTAAVKVYANACAHAEAQAGFSWDDGDVNFDCTVDMDDFLYMVFRWLDDYNNIFNELYTGSRDDITGRVGFTFRADADFAINALCRAVNPDYNGGVLQTSHVIELFEVSSGTLLASTTVDGSSEIDMLGYAFEYLAAPVDITAGQEYMVLSEETLSSGDPWKTVFYASSYSSDVISILGSEFSYALPGNPMPESCKHFGEDALYVPPAFSVILAADSLGAPYGLADFAAIAANWMNCYHPECP